MFAVVCANFTPQSSFINHSLYSLSQWVFIKRSLSISLAAYHIAYSNNLLLRRTLTMYYHLLCNSKLIRFHHWKSRLLPCLCWWLEPEYNFREILAPPLIKFLLHRRCHTELFDPLFKFCDFGVSQPNQLAIRFWCCLSVEKLSLCRTSFALLSRVNWNKRGFKKGTLVVDLGLNML